LKKSEKTPESDVGVLFCRAQPWHIGHQAIIDEIEADGLIPMIIFGGSNKYDDRHPYHWERKKMLDLSGNTSALYAFLDDNEDWDIWLKDVEAVLPDNPIIYINNKPQDRICFTIKGKTYEDAFYNDMWHDLGYTTKHVTFPELRGLEGINATSIRNDLEKMRWALHSNVYKYIKELNAI